MAIVSIVSLLMVVGMVVYPRINFNTLYPSIRKTQTVVPTPTLSPEQELYKKSLNGKPMLVDPLDGTSPEQWNTGNGCDFANGTLHSTISNDGSKNIAAMSPCWDQSSNYSNFALKVDYKINQGEMADVLIRGEDPNFPWGDVCVFSNNTAHTDTSTYGNGFACWVGDKNGGGGGYAGTELDSTPGKWYTAVFIVKQTSIYLYRDGNFVLRTDDTRWRPGGTKIGFTAQQNDKGTADSNFRNLEIWRL